MADLTFPCSDCRVPTEPIRILDRVRNGYTELGYTVDGPSDILRLGVLRGRICPQCGRVTLYGEAAPSHLQPPPPAPAATSAPPIDHEAVDPPQRIEERAYAEPLAAEVIDELQPEALPWKVHLEGASGVLEFATEAEAEAAARALLAEQGTARVFVHGARGRRYRVLP